MANNTGSPTPGFATEQTYTPRQVLANSQSGLYLPRGVVIDGSKSRDPLQSAVDVDVLRPGMLLGKISATGLWAPSIIGVLPEAHTTSGSSVTSLTAGVANAVEIVRRIGSSGTFKLVGPPTANGTNATQTVTFSAVNVSTGVVTITDLTANAVAGSFISPTDGSETPLAILNEHLKVTDQDKASQNTQCRALLIGGLIDSSQIINWPSDTSLQAYLVSALNTYGQFVFDHGYGF